MFWHATKPILLRHILNQISINAPNKNQRLCKCTKLILRYRRWKIKDSFNHCGITVPIQTSKWCYIFRSQFLEILPVQKLGYCLDMSIVRCIFFRSWPASSKWKNYFPFHIHFLYDYCLITYVSVICFVFWCYLLYSYKY